MWNNEIGEEVKCRVEAKIKGNGEGWDKGDSTTEVYCWWQYKRDDVGLGGRNGHGRWRIKLVRLTLMSYTGPKARLSYFMLTWTRQMERGRYANCCLIGLSGYWGPVKPLSGGESEQEQENTENYWISFSCHSLHISLSNFSLHQYHWVSAPSLKSRFFQP